MADCKIGPETRARIAAAWPELMAKIADGAPIGATVRDMGFSGGELRAYRATEPGADADWQRAKEESAEYFFEAAQDIASNPGPDAKAARVKLQALMWLAAKRNPRAYADRAALDVSVKHVDLTRIIEDANARLAGARNPALADRAASAVDAQILQHALPQSIKDLL